MEARLNMLQEENHISDYSINSRYMHDRSIRRLQWIVAGCVACLCILMCLTVYHILGGDILCSKDKDHHDSPNPQEMYGKPASAKPSAHLTGTYQNDLQATELHWETQNGLAFIRDGMHYVNKSIEIPQDGFYFVYSKVSFSNPCDNNNDNLQEIKVLKFNRNYPEPDPLLSGISHCVENILQPIYVGAHLALKKYDKLKVTVTNIKLIDYSLDDKTFFGAFCV